VSTAECTEVDAGQLAERLHDARRSDPTSGVSDTPWPNLSGERQTAWTAAVQYALDEQPSGPIDPEAFVSVFHAKRYDRRWIDLPHTHRNRWVRYAQEALDAMSTDDGEKPSIPGVYLFGQMTIEATREMLTCALDDAKQCHNESCADGTPAEWCTRPGRECGRQIGKLQHALAQLPVPQPAEPSEVGSVVRVLVNPETCEAIWFKQTSRLSARRVLWVSFGDAGTYSWGDIVSLAQRHGVTIELVSATLG